MKLCPTCKNKYADDANFCPREECAGPQGPQRLAPLVEEAPARFVPISKIGGGASGEVWQASDTQSGGAVAYKVVAAQSLPTVTSQERAQRELRQLQRANNPHIVKVVDFGKTPEGQLFVASELASGEPLDQLVARTGPFALDRAKRIAAQIGEALLEAQKVGVVHRDLAAKNILVSGDDEVRIINFAIPRPATETLFGVPEYMSPEQSEGKLIDQRSNTYSLGALLYLMLTGYPPHTGETMKALIESIQKGEITPPSIKRASAASRGAGGTGGPGLTAEVDRILLKAMERSSSRRPLTMRQFLNDVSGLIVTDQASAASNAAAGGRDAAFARTMMFAGGASEVQKLVAQAVAARQAAGNGAAEPVAAAPVAAAPVAAAPVDVPAEASQPSRPVAVAGPSFDARAGGTPSPASRPAHGAAVAATMISMPAAGTSIPGASAAAPRSSTSGDSGGMASSQPTPPLGNSAPGSGPTPAPVGAAGNAATPGPDAANFRETLWFKKGDVDQMVADARAKVAAMASANAATAAAAAAAKKEAEVSAEDAKPLEDRYVDDGTVTVDDRKKFSLRSGGTATTMPSRGGSVPGERMTEDEILDEIGGGKRLVIIGIVGAVAVALIAVIAVSLKSKSKTADQPPVAPAAVVQPPVAAPVAAPPPPPPAPPVPPPRAAVEETPPPPPAPKTVRAESRGEPAPRSTSAKKRAAAKKKAAVASKKRK